jgi:hypothetical protein
MFIVVNTLEDENNGINQGNISLRDAINQANTSPGRDLIRFDRSLRGETITLENGDLFIDDDLRIVGLGKNNLTIDGNEGTIFNVNRDNTGLVDVKIEDLSLVNAEVAIDGQGIIEIENLTISGNSVGISTGGTLNTINTTLFDNGITIDSTGTLNMYQSTVSGNRGYILFDAGIAFSGSANIVNSIISDNIGDGIRLNGRARMNTLNIVNTTIANNSDEGVGFYSKFEPASIVNTRAGSPQCC